MAKFVASNKRFPLAVGDMVCSAIGPAPADERPNAYGQWAVQVRTINEKTGRPVFNRLIMNRAEAIRLRDHLIKTLDTKSDGIDTYIDKG